MNDDDECSSRREAELEMIAAAYPDEIQILDTKSLERTVSDQGTSFRIRMEMNEGYPESSSLCVTSVDIVESTSRKSAIEAIPSLLEVCRDSIVLEEESIFAVMLAADTWMAEVWPEKATTTSTVSFQVIEDKKTQVLGRRLIYSHHIISNKKRSDMKYLAQHYKLTGYIKVGWPGLVILEGDDESCNRFFDDMRQWNWQYLVVRGEMQEHVQTTLDGMRKFEGFVETESMSEVADHCRRVGLEDLFFTSMKKYGGAESANETVENEESYGVLIHVDHMNDGKGYRKWLRRICKEHSVSLFIKQTYPNDDYSKRPVIIVALLSKSQDEVRTVLKRWRTSQVDVNSVGKGCLERMLTVLQEGVLDLSSAPAGGEMDLDDDVFANAEPHINCSTASLRKIVLSLGGEAWLTVMDASCL